MHLPCKQAYVGALPTILRLESELARGFQAKDVLHRLGEGGLFITGIPSYGWQASLAGWSHQELVALSQS